MAQLMHSFRGLEPPPEILDGVRRGDIASFCLFACEPAAFSRVWSGLRAALRPGARFAGQLLGPRDSWAGRSDTTIVDRETLDGMLAGLRVEHLEEEESDAVTPRGEAKHWHIWHVNAHRPL